MNTISTIKLDIMRNKDINNHLFFYVFRLGNTFMQGGWISKICSIPFRIVMRLHYNRYNHIPLETSIGGGIRFPHLQGIVLSGKAVIGERCTIMHQVTIGVDDIKMTGAPKLGNNIYVGAGAKLIGDIRVGNDVKIGAGAIVTKSVPSGKTVVGINRILR